MINTMKKTPSSGKSLISTYSFLRGGRGKGVGFGCGRLFEFEQDGEGVGAY